MRNGFHSQYLTNTIDFVLVLLSVFLILSDYFYAYQIDYLDDFIERTMPLSTLPCLTLLRIMIHHLVNEKKQIPALQNPNISTIKEEICEVKEIVDTQRRENKAARFDWNFHRISLNINDKSIEESKIIRSMMTQVSKLEFSIEFFPNYSQQFTNFYLKEIIKYLKQKHLPKDALIKKQSSSLSDLLLIEKGKVGVFINVESSLVQVYSLTSYLFDIYNKLKATALKTLGQDNIVFMIKNTKFIEVLELCNYRMANLQQIESEANTNTLPENQDAHEQPKRIYANSEAGEANQIRENSTSAFNISKIIDGMSSLTQTISDLIAKHTKQKPDKKKRSKKLSRMHLASVKYFFKEDFQNVFHYFFMNIEQESQFGSGISIIYLNNYNSPEKKNELIISKATNYEILQS